MKQEKYSAIAIIVAALFFGVIMMLFLMPEETGMATQKQGIEDLFREYFLLSAAINYQANNAVSLIEAERAQYSSLSRPIQEYFACSTLLQKTEKARKMRSTVMQEFSRLAEMNCFNAVSEADLKKFKLLENQCRSKSYDASIPEKLTKIYAYQKEALNKGCMKQTELFDLLRTTQLKIFRQETAQ